MVLFVCRGGAETTWRYDVKDRVIYTLTGAAFDRRHFAHTYLLSGCCTHNLAASPLTSTPLFSAHEPLHTIHEHVYVMGVGVRDIRKIVQVFLYLFSQK